MKFEDFKTQESKVSIIIDPNKLLPPQEGVSRLRIWDPKTGKEGFLEVIDPVRDQRVDNHRVDSHLGAVEDDTYENSYDADMDHPLYPGWGF